MCSEMRDAQQITQRMEEINMEDCHMSGDMYSFATVLKLQDSQVRWRGRASGFFVLTSTCVFVSTTRFFLFLFLAASETRYGARRRVCLKLSYSPPYDQAENPEGCLSLPLATTSHPCKLPKHTLDTNTAPEAPKSGL